MSTSKGSHKQTNVLVFRAAGGREERVGRAGSQVWHYHGYDDHDDRGDEDDEHHDGGDNHGDDGDNYFGDFLILRVWQRNVDADKIGVVDDAQNSDERCSTA